MKNQLLLIFLFIGVTVSGQIEYRTIQSQKLQAEREIKIQLPRGYNSDSTQVYPVFIVLDGDYLFEPIAGMADYFSYWDDMPGVIVVGVNHNNQRGQDVYIDSQRALPSETGAKFFEFLGSELLPLIDNNYRTAKFAGIVGHDKTANFMNYYLLKDDPLFQVYINLSPEYPPKMRARIAANLKDTKKEFWYYLATSDNDVESLKQEIIKMKETLSKIDNPKLHFIFDNFENASHYSLVGRAIPKAMEAIFSIYSPITAKEYEEGLLKTKGTFVEYLEEEYKKIKKLYDLDIKVNVDDFMQVSTAIEEEGKWDQYRDLARLAEDEYPETTLPNYFWGRYEEETGDPEDAFEEYQKAYSKKEISFLTKDYMLDLADEIKAKNDF
jgi:predicted alpha/beta superfamily hydrolase